jgi:hypothetical protein
MPTNYETELLSKNFRGNVIIRFIGQYFAIHEPDSGLTIGAPYNTCVKSLIVNPTQVDLRRANQTIANYSFRLVDKANVITALVKERGDALVGQEVEIWIGRITGSFDFSDYFKLPMTKIKKIQHSENAYYISVGETTDRMRKPVFDLNNKLAGSILDSSTTLTLAQDITDLPSSGTCKIESEFISWSGKDNTLKQLTGLLRGLKGSTAAAHGIGQNFLWVYDVTDNPLDILLKLLISDGGGGAYDVYPSGLGIDQNLIDTTAIEAIRDSLFLGEQFSYSLYNITDCLKFIEDEILLGCNLRFVTSSNSKISLAVLDQSVFGDAPNSMDEDTISSYPSWEVDDNEIVNVIEVQWDWDEGTQTYNKISTYRNEDSITTNGERDTYKIKLKGPKDSLDGQAIIDDRTDRFLERFGSPNPKISFKTQIDKHLIEVGSKVLVQSSQIPFVSGTLQFATELEVVSRGINFETGDVTFKLAFTSYSDIRPCYIAPSDLVDTVIDQRTITVVAGRGDAYTAGWKMRLWDSTAIGYTADAVNEIESIAGDTITFKDAFVTTLVAGQHRIKFADYDDATLDQRRYCFISDDGNDFDDGSATYKITF